jgi:hypothetical protein
LVWKVTSFQFGADGPLPAALLHDFITPAMASSFSTNTTIWGGLPDYF